MDSETGRQARQYNVMKVNVVESANSCAYFAKTGMHTAQVQSVQASSVVVCFSHQSPSSLVALWSDSALLVVQLFRGGLQEADKRDSPAGGTEREGAGIVSCTFTVSLLVLFNETHELRGLLRHLAAVGTLVGSPSGVQWRLVPLYCCVA